MIGMVGLPARGKTYIGTKSSIHSYAVIALSYDPLTNSELNMTGMT
jgi:hypothetical protein